MPWVLRGLRNGVVTTRYPGRSDDYAVKFPATVSIHPPERVPGPGVAQTCPTGAIGYDEAGSISLDRGRCILCGNCVANHPDIFSWEPGSDTSRLQRSALVVPETDDLDTARLRATREDLARRVRALRRSVHIRHVDAGSDGSEEWEIHALTNPTYDVHRLGIFFTASPRHADILMVTGAGARGMLAPLRRTHEAMPNPVVVIAVGTDAISGGLISPSYATAGGVLDELPADVLVPGSPPPPFAILHGVLLALGRIALPASQAGISG